MSSDEQKRQVLAQKLYRNLKSKQKSGKEESSSKAKHAKEREKSQNKEKEADLTKRAIEEIQRDTKRAATLADEIGPSGWRKASSKRTNKRFLANTMRSVLSHNERTKAKHETEARRKFTALTKRPPKFGARLHSFRTADERMDKEPTRDSS